MIILQGQGVSDFSVTFIGDLWAIDSDHMNVGMKGSIQSVALLQSYDLL